MFADSVRFIQKAAVFHPREPSVLLLRRSVDDAVRPNDWDFPGGNVHFGELHDASLSREVFEETGLRIAHFIPLKVMSAFDADENVHVLHIIYTCEADSSEVLLSGEHHAYRWFNASELEASSQSRYTALALEALKTRAGTP